MAHLQVVHYLQSFFPSSVLSHRLFVPSASVTPDLCLFGSEHFLSSLNVLFASWICAGTFFPWANPDLALIVALQRLPETCRAWGGERGAVLPLFSAIGGGVASFLIFLEAPQGLILSAMVR